MTNRKFTYRLSRMFLIFMAWEVIFWALYGVLVSALGMFDDGKGDEILLYRYPERFYWMLLIVPITFAFILFLHKHNKRALSLKPRVREAYIRPVSEGYTIFKWIMFRNVIVFMIIAFAQPVFGKRKSEATVENLELVICLDVSNSMNTRDISDELSRLEIAKRAMNQLINKLHGERIGICLFANDALVQLPITRDYGAAKLFIDEIETDLVGNQGTNVKAALEVSRKMFSKDRTAKGIIMVTDGENHESNPSKELKKIRNSKIQLCVLGIGTKKGGLVPVNPRRPDLGYKKTATGKAVRSKVNPKFIESIATKAGGKASLSDDEFPDLSALLTQITRMKRTKIDNFDFDIRTERYQIPLVFALISWLIYLLWSEDVSTRLNRKLE
ncbi:MAG: VWA domain-containing protein [Fluviicola sp.]